MSADVSLRPTGPICSHNSFKAIAFIVNQSHASGGGWTAIKVLLYIKSTRINFVRLNISWPLSLLMSACICVYLYLQEVDAAGTRRWGDPDKAEAGGGLVTDMWGHHAAYKLGSTILSLWHYTWIGQQQRTSESNTIQVFSLFPNHSQTFYTFIILSMFSMTSMQQLASICFTAVLKLAKSELVTYFVLICKTSFYMVRALIRYWCLVCVIGLLTHIALVRKLHPMTNNYRIRDLV